MENMTIDIDKNVRIARIKDSKGRIHFTVSLYTFDPPQTISNPDPLQVKYEVKVREISNLNVPHDIIREFFTEGDRKKATDTFQSLITKYNTLVQYIDKQLENPPEVSAVFNSEINYHIIDPDCCANCVNAIFDENKKENRMTRPRIFCRLKKNIRQFQYTYDLFGEDNIRNPQFSDCPSPIQVDFNGLCNNYSRCINR